MRYENETIELENGLFKDITWKIDDDGNKTEYCSVTYTKSDEEISPEPSDIELLQEQVTELQLALCEQYEENLLLKDEVTNTQLAIVELYEGSFK